MTNRHKRRILRKVRRYFKRYNGGKYNTLGLCTCAKLMCLKEKLSYKESLWFISFIADDTNNNDKRSNKYYWNSNNTQIRFDWLKRVIKYKSYNT